MFELTTDRDWPEDFADENGNYQNQCRICNKLFCGNKHRLVCKKCVTEGELAWAALSPAEQEAETKKNLEEIKKWLDANKGTW